MNNSYLKRWIFFSVCLALVFGGTALFYGLRSAKYERHLVNTAESSLSALIYSTEQMANGLSSMHYGNEGSALLKTAAEVYANSQAAKAALSALPLSGSNMEQYEKLINQAGEYSLSLLSGSGRKEKLSSGDIYSVDSVATALSALNERVSAIKEQLDVGEVLCGGVVSSGKSPCLSSEFAKLEKEFPEYSALVYDGGFSEHISSRSALHTNGMEETAIEDARKIAAAFLKTEESKLELLYDSDGTIPVFAFGENKRVVEVTKSGGLILTFSDRRTPGSKKISESQAREKALQFASNLGFSDLYCRYSSTQNNILTAELFPISNGVTVYPDRVTVSVTLDNGELAAFDSRDYLMNHTSRNLALPGVIPSGASPVLVPTDGMHEKLCFEYSEDGCLRYVCAESGDCYKIHLFKGDEQRGLSDHNDAK